MSHKLLSSVAAAALFVSGGIAFAQSGEGHHGAGAGAGMTGASPSAGHNGAEQGGMQRTPSAEKSAPMHSSDASGASQDRPSHKADAATPSTAGKTDHGQKAAMDKGSDPKSRDRSAERDTDKSKNEGRSAADTRSNDTERMNRGDQRENAGRDTDRSTASRDKDTKSISTDKQAKISETIRNEHVENIRNVDFDVRVGGIVPERHHFNPLPEAIVALVPEYRGYDYIVANDEVVIVEPSTHRIVYTMSEGRSAAIDHPSTGCR